MDPTKEEYCLGNSCRFYREKPDAICFKQGVLPECSPALKQVRTKLDNTSVEMYEILKALKETDSYWWQEVDLDILSRMDKVLAKVKAEKED